jgi:hypothetical protein
MQKYNFQTNLLKETKIFQNIITLYLVVSFMSLFGNSRKLIKALLFLYLEC